MDKKTPREVTALYESESAPHESSVMDCHLANYFLEACDSRLVRCRRFYDDRRIHCAPLYLPKCWVQLDEFNWVRQTDMLYRIRVREPTTRIEVTFNNAISFAVFEGDFVSGQILELPHVIPMTALCHSNIKITPRVDIEAIIIPLWMRNEMVERPWLIDTHTEVHSGSMIGFWNAPWYNVSITV